MGKAMHRYQLDLNGVEWDIVADAVLQSTGGNPYKRNAILSRMHTARPDTASAREASRALGHVWDTHLGALAPVALDWDTVEQSEAKRAWYYERRQACGCETCMRVLPNLKPRRRKVVADA